MTSLNSTTLDSLKFTAAACLTSGILNYATYSPVYQTAFQVSIAVGCLTALFTQYKMSKAERLKELDFIFFPSGCTIIGHPMMVLAGFMSQIDPLLRSVDRQTSSIINIFAEAKANFDHPLLSSINGLALGYAITNFTVQVIRFLNK